MKRDMSFLLRNPITFVWLVLVAATAASWELGHGIGFEDVRHASLAIILVSLVKVRLVIRHFMEVRHAPSVMKWVSDGWLVVLAVALCVLYLRG
jgi:hypothetical protein